jgi:hypothetical protein
MIYEPGGVSLATICLSLEIPRRTFAALFLLSREAGDAAEQLGAQEVAQAMSFYDRINPMAARRVVARWRRNADYLNAIRQVTAGPAVA